MKLLTLSSEIGTRTVLALSFLCSAIMIIDSIIVALYVDIASPPGYVFNLLLFTSFVLFFIVTNYMFLAYSKQDYITKTFEKAVPFKALNLILTLNQFALCGALVFVIIQLFAFYSYYLSIVEIAIYMSHISSIGCLLFLAFKFLLWFKTNRNYIFLMYACAFSLLVLNVFISLIFLSLEFSYYSEVIKVKSIKRQVIDSSVPTINLIPLITAYDYVSVLSFVFAWIPTVMLLKTYSKRLGNIRYWAYVMIPLLYFLFPFLANEFGIFEKVQLEYGKQFSLIYTMFISPYKQVGGILFGIVFVTAAIKIRRENLRKLMVISGIGMTLLFGSIVLHGMTYIVTPPFGLMTLSIMGLASYILLIGLLVSSMEIARDVHIRRELYHIAEEQVQLLRNLGQVEMERVIEKRSKPIIEKAITLEKDSQHDAFEQEDYKEMIREVLDELKSRKQ